MRHSSVITVALLGLAAVVFAYPLIADAGTVHLYPSGDTTGVSDHDAVQAAIDAAADGDTIHLAAGDWYFGKPFIYGTDTRRPVTIPGGTLTGTKEEYTLFGDPDGSKGYVWPDDYYGNGLMFATLHWWTYAGTEQHYIYIQDKAIHIEGDVDANGDPATVIRTSNEYDVSQWGGIFGEDNPSDFHFLFANSSYREVKSSLKNLKFYRVGLYSVINLSPIDVDNCYWEESGPFVMMNIQDDYTVYENLPQEIDVFEKATADIGEPLHSIFSNVKTINSLQWTHVNGAGAIYENCEFNVLGGTPIYFEDLYDDPWLAAQPFRPGFSMIAGRLHATSRDNTVRNCVFNNVGAMGAGVSAFSAVEDPITGNARQPTNNVVTHSTVDGALSYAIAFSEQTDGLISHNIITQSNRGITVQSSVSPKIIRNTFVDQKTIYEGAQRPGILLFGNELGVQDASVIANDFTDSGYTGATDTILPNYESWSVWVTDTLATPNGPLTMEPVVNTFINEPKLPEGTTTSTQIKDDGVNSRVIQH